MIVIRESNKNKFLQDEYGKFSLVEYVTLGLEIWNPTQGIWNTGIQSVKSTIQDCF